MVAGGSVCKNGEVCVQRDTLQSCSSANISQSCAHCVGTNFKRVTFEIQRRKMMIYKGGGDAGEARATMSAAETGDCSVFTSK